MQELFTIQEAAERLKVNHQTIRRLIKNEKIKAIKIGGQYRILEEEITKLINGENRSENENV